MKPAGLPGANYSVCTMHAMVEMKTGKGRISRDLIMAPAALANKTAGTLWAAVCNRCPGENGVEGWLALSERACLVLSSDSASANSKLARQCSWMFDNHLVLWTHCLQHQVALVLACITVQLDLLSLVFGSCKLLRGGMFQLRMRRAIRSILQRKLVVIERAPDDAQVACTSLLIERTFLRSSWEHEHPAPVLATAMELKALFNGDVRKDTVVEHYCMNGCCENRANTIDRMTSVLCAILGSRLEVPAVNRWTSLEPAIAVHCLLLALHGALLVLFSMHLQQIHGPTTPAFRQAQSVIVCLCLLVTHCAKGQLAQKPGGEVVDFLK